MLYSMGFKYLREKMQSGELSDNRRRALNVIVKTCCDNHVRLQTPLEKYVYYDSTVGSNGFFIDDPAPILAFGLDHPQDQWFTTACHEYSHMCQWLSHDPLWECYEDEGSFEDWIDHKIELAEIQLTKMINGYILLELDAEMRTVEFMKRLDVGINIEEYTQKSNSYVLFYHLIKRDRAFYVNGKEPYKIENVWKRMPITFDTIDYLAPLSYDLESVFDECRR